MAGSGFVGVIMSWYWVWTQAFEFHLATVPRIWGSKEKVNGEEKPAPGKCTIQRSLLEGPADISIVLSSGLSFIILTCSKESWKRTPHNVPPRQTVTLAQCTSLNTGEWRICTGMNDVAWCFVLPPNSASAITLCFLLKMDGDSLSESVSCIFQTWLQFPK